MSTPDQPDSPRAKELARLIDQFKDKYGSFESERYIQDERAYKLRLMEYTRTNLSKKQLERLIAVGSFEEAARLIRRAYQRPENNLLNSWDRLPLENAPDEQLVRTLYNLLYGDAPFEQRFTAWLALLKQQAPNCWPAATFFLMLADPQEHIFVKPVPFRALMVRLTPEVPWTTRPTVEAYAHIRQLAKELSAQLRPEGARDLIDVQSFVWVLQPENERAWIFQSNPDYYDLPGALAEHTEFTWSARQRAEDLRIGDTVYLWESGEHAGILAVATITGEPEVGAGGELDQRFYRDKTQFSNDQRRVPMRIERVLARRLTRAELLEHPQLSKLQIIQQPRATNFKVSELEAVALESLVAAIPDAPKVTLRWPPHPLDGPVFVVSYPKSTEWQQYGETFSFTTYAIGDRPKLISALHDVQQGGQPVYLIIYRPSPQQAFSAWARVKSFTEQPSGREGDPKDIRWTLTLEQYEFPQPLALKGNARFLTTQVSWLKQGLQMAFQGYAMRQVAPEDAQMILNAARQQPDIFFPSTWEHLAPVRDFIQALEQRPYTAAELHTAAGTLATDLTPDEFAERLQWLRVLHHVDEEGYYVPDYARGDPAIVLRMMALGLLLPFEGGYIAPSVEIVFDRGITGAPAQLEETMPAFPDVAFQILRWYEEAGLLQLGDSTWALETDAFDPRPGDDATTRIYNALITVGGAADSRSSALAPPEHAALQVSAHLDRCLAELADDLIIDPQVVRRVYRSLLAGRHVVLSGPPGTGKTELAQRLPKLLWRENDNHAWLLSLNPDDEPVRRVNRGFQGYATTVVTATEDWGVRDVVGGIGPQLDENRRLSYTIQHGALTRAVLQHYDGTQSGERLPEQGFTRCSYNDGDTRYRGVWLVIDEFTRAPVDAAFGSLLTTLSGGDTATLAVPTAGGAVKMVPVPPDFRIIGTLNSFDRHFLNQISEALKRRFDFIDVLPPAPKLYEKEQGIATARALRRLRENGFQQIVIGDGKPRPYDWTNVVRALPGSDGYKVVIEDPGAGAALTSLWSIFQVFRYFRQFGTAQLVALLTTLFTGRLIGMSWDEALDTSLADTIADQLQVLTRDEQQVIEYFIAFAGQDQMLVTKLQDMVKTGRTNGRRAAMLRSLRDAEVAYHGSSTIDPEGDQQLTPQQIERLFEPSASLALPPDGVFLRRLRSLTGERGL